MSRADPAIVAQPGRAITGSRRRGGAAGKAEFALTMPRPPVWFRTAESGSDEGPARQRRGVDGGEPDERGLVVDDQPPLGKAEGAGGAQALQRLVEGDQ